MQSLSEIIEAVKNGEKPDYDDLRFGLLALSYLHTFDTQDMLEVFEKISGQNPMLAIRAEESFNRSKRAMSVPPRKYLSDDWNPDNPEYQKQRRLMSKLLDKILKDSDGS
jgi:hypothetical protein